MGQTTSGIDVPSANPRVAAAVEAASFDLSAQRSALAAALRDGPRLPQRGHVCGDALVTDTGRTRVLLMYHHLVGWMFPGGHMEREETPATTAARELAEETGIEAVPNPRPPLALYAIDVPGHDGRPSHRHWSLVYTFETAASATRASAEGEVAWWHLDRLPANTCSVVIPVLRLAG